MHFDAVRSTGRGAGTLMRLVVTAVLASIPVLAEAPIQLISRRQIVNDIHESVYSVRTGNGEFDRIQVHRVVRELRRQPLETDKAIMLVHGDVWGFNAAFMPAESGGHSLPAYLAGQGADVWGVDLAWTLGPPSTTDFGFMREWGLQHDIDDVTAALETAEKLRNNHARFTVLGWSRGAWILYGLLNQESQRPCARRLVKAAIPFDGALKFDDPSIVAFACSQAAAVADSMRAGQFNLDARVWPLSGRLTEEHPDDPSPILGPPFTNRQALLKVGAAGWTLFGPSFSPQYHFVAGVFPNDDTTQTPTDLRYSEWSRFTQFARTGSPYMPLRMIGDTFRTSCEKAPTGLFDNNLGAIQVPILYVGARGGFGTSGLATLRLLGSTNIETHVVSLRPQSAQGLDFGHVDLVHARNAPDLVWSTIDRWLTAQAHDTVCESRPER